MYGRQVGVWKPRRRTFAIQREHHALRRLIGHENYGINVFEGCRMYSLADGSRAIFRWEDHKRRLIESADAYGMPVAEWPFTPEQLWNTCLKVAALNERDSYLRPCIYIEGDLKVYDPKYTITAWVATRDWDPDKNPYLSNSGGRGLRLLITDLRRSPPQPQTWAKGAANYVLSWKAKKISLGKFTDALVLDDSGQLISEGSGYAVLFYSHTTNTVTAPDASSSALDSITKRTVEEMCKFLGVHFVTARIPKDMVYTATEMFVAGTAIEIGGVSYVEDTVSGRNRDFYPVPGTMTRVFQQLYRKIVTADKLILDESMYTRLPSWEEAQNM